MMSKLDFTHFIPDDQLVEYSRIPLLERLKWLDEICRFTLAMRDAPGGPIKTAAVNGVQMEQFVMRED